MKNYTTPLLRNSKKQEPFNNPEAHKIHGRIMYHYTKPDTKGYYLDYMHAFSRLKFHYCLGQHRVIILQEKICKISPIHNRSIEANNYLLPTLKFKYNFKKISISKEL